MNPLPPKRRSELRSRAHKLAPVVIIGDKGLTDDVLAEIDRALRAHELVKVRAAAGERDARNGGMESICEKLEAHPVQQIGKVLVVFRENPRERPAPGLPPGGGRRGGAPGGARAGLRRTARPRSRTPSPRPASAPRRRRPRTSR